MNASSRPLLCLLVLVAWLHATAQSDTLSIRVVHAGCDTTVTLARMRTLTPRTATVRSHDGEQAVYEGAWLKDVLTLGCASIAAIEKRTMVRGAVRIEAADGYRALVALTEADSSFRERPVILAWKRGGEPLDGHYGPFQLIVPDDQRHARNVRMVKALEVVVP